MTPQMFKERIGSDAHFYINGDSNLLVAYKEEVFDNGDDKQETDVQIAIADTDPKSMRTFRVEFSKALGETSLSESSSTREYCFPVGMVQHVGLSLGNYQAQKAILSAEAPAMGPIRNHEVGFSNVTPNSRLVDPAGRALVLHMTEFTDRRDPIMTLGDIALFPFEEE